MSNDFQKQFDWQMQYIPQVVQKIRTNAGHFLSFEIASPYEDKCNGTDMMMDMGGDGCRWAVRLRTPESTNWEYDGRPRFRDPTIRCKGTGKETELDKLRRSVCPYQWYFYGWLGYDGILREYIIFDVQRAWGAGLFRKKRKPIKNYDGTTEFVVINHAELIEKKALVVSCIRDIHGGLVYYRRTLPEDL